MEEISLSNLFIEMTLTCSLDKKKGPRKREIKKFKVENPERLPEEDGREHSCGPDSSQVAESICEILVGPSKCIPFIFLFMNLTYLFIPSFS